MQKSLVKLWSLVGLASAFLGFGVLSPTSSSQDHETSGKGEVYYAGSSDEELAKVVRRALDQLSEFKEVSTGSDSGIFVSFDDSRMLIDCKASDEIDRLCVSVFYGCKPGVRADDPQLLELVNEMNQKFNIAKWCVLSLQGNLVLQAQVSLPFINFLSRHMLLAWFAYSEKVVDLAVSIERDRLRQYLK